MTIKIETQVEEKIELKISSDEIAKAIILYFKQEGYDVDGYDVEPGCPIKEQDGRNGIEHSYQIVTLKKKSNFKPEPQKPTFVMRKPGEPMLH